MTLNHFLIDSLRRDQIALLIIDEAQNLSAEMLEEVRLLSNLETPTSKLLQILLVGQPELNDILDRPDLRQLRQRIVLRHELRPFDEEETGAYVEERLRLAGYTGKEVFKRSAVRTIWEVTGGVPRLVNVVCDSALLLGYARGWTRIERGAILEVARDLDLPAATPRRPGETSGSQPMRWMPFGFFRKRSAGRA
jgi:general secretion pathway protein A